MGDLDGDGTVAFGDFLILSENFGRPDANYSMGDLDCNGSVGFPDFLILSANFGQAVGAEGAAVPEPSGRLLLAIAGILSGLVRWRRLRS